MKYDNWNEMSDTQKYKAFKKEADLETHNATTKDDLVNIVKWLWNRFDYEGWENRGVTADEQQSTSE